MAEPGPFGLMQIRICILWISKTPAVYDVVFSFGACKQDVNYSEEIHYFKGEIKGWPCN